jgi:hypothetical protein
MEQDVHDRFHSVEERLARQDARAQNIDSNWRQAYDILRRRLDRLEADDQGEKATVQPTPADRVEEYMANSVGWQHPWCVAVNVFGVHVRDDLKSDTRKHLRAMAEGGKLDRIGASLYQWRGEIELEEEEPIEVRVTGESLEEMSPRDRRRVARMLRPTENQF